MGERERETAAQQIGWIRALSGGGGGGDGDGGAQGSQVCLAGHSL